MFGQGTWNLLEAAADEDASPRFGNPSMNGIAGLVLPNGQTAYCACHSGLLRCPRLGGVDEDAVRIAGLIDDLKDDRFSTREKATRRLQAMPLTVRPVLKKALEQSTDPEQKTRLESILEKMCAAVASGEIESTFGSVPVSGCRQLMRTAAAASSSSPRKSITSKRAWPSWDATARWPRCWAHILASAWPMMSMDNTPPILLPSGNQFWLPSVGTSEPARLVDLKKMEVVDTLPHPQCNRLYAVSADGRPYVSSTYFGRIMVYTPQAKNTESPLQVSHTEVHSPELIRITEEGSVWTGEDFVEALKGRKQPVTVLFSDIRGFTSMTESSDADKLVAQFNEYFRDMVGSVLQNNGTLQKFIGDAIMAVWGDHLQQRPRRRRAGAPSPRLCRCAPP